MHEVTLEPWMHPHRFLGARHDEHARRTRWVVVLTFGMMVVEVTGGLWTHSMALLADGLHMSTHALAIGIATLAYGYAKRHGQSDRFVFGTGKVGDLAGFASAILLGVVAVGVAVESVQRMIASRVPRLLGGAANRLRGPGRQSRIRRAPARRGRGRPRQQPSFGVRACRGRRRDLGARHRRDPRSALPRMALAGPGHGPRRSSADFQLVLRPDASRSRSPARPRRRAGAGGTDPDAGSSGETCGSAICTSGGSAPATTQPSSPSSRTRPPARIASGRRWRTSRP